MIYVFTFLGEFGYELLNWQGVIRKFSRTIGPSDRIFCCSRAYLYPLYETASLYVDISEVDLFKNSQACCYSAILPGSQPDSRNNVAFGRKLNSSLKRFIADHLPVTRARWFSFAKEKIVFVFSSNPVRINDCTFGEGDIYDRLDLNNNFYRKIEPDLSVRNEIENHIGFSLSEPYVLVQTRTREVVVRSRVIIPKEQMIQILAEQSKVVLLSFNTMRKFDSYSQFNTVPNCFHYTGTSFAEQACLIHFAKKCLFFTEGDFGSHIYVPPFLGKDVYVIAPREVYEIGTTPIDFWNRNVFRFGGQIIPKIAEEVFISPECIRECCG